MDINHNEKWQQEMCYSCPAQRPTDIFQSNVKNCCFKKRRRKKRRKALWWFYKNIATNYESNAIWKKWMKILQRINCNTPNMALKWTNTVSLLCSLKSSKEINTKSLWFIWACHRDETEHGESKNKNLKKNMVTD